MSKPCDGFFIDRFRSIAPLPVHKDIMIEELIDGCCWGHNARSLRDACHIFCEMAATGDCVIGLSLGGALVPAGLGESALIPLIKSHMVDWIVSTGANIYHDLHAQLGYEMKMGSERWDDSELRKQGIIRIHNVVFDQGALFDTDKFLRKFCADIRRKGRGNLSTSKFCKLLGEALLELDKSASGRSFVAAAAEEGVPVFCPAIADSSIGMNLAALALLDEGITINPILDVNESSAIVYASKKSSLRTGALILGGGVAKNFQLQTEPHIQEVLGLTGKGHDFFIQFTDARIDTGGLSGATPSEAVTWGKINPDEMAKAVVCYSDCTLVFPIFVSYALKKVRPRRARRMLDEIDRYVGILREDYKKALENSGDSAL